VTSSYVITIGGIIKTVCKEIDLNSCGSSMFSVNTHSSSHSFQSSCAELKNKQKYWVFNHRVVTLVTVKLRRHGYQT